MINEIAEIEKSAENLNEKINEVAESVAKKALKQFPGYDSYTLKQKVKGAMLSYPEALQFSPRSRNKLAERSLRNFESEKCGSFLLRMKIMDCMFLGLHSSLIFDECLIKKREEKLEISGWEMVLFFQERLIEHYLRQKEFTEKQMKDCKEKGEEDSEATFKQAFAVIKWIFAVTFVESRKEVEGYRSEGIYIDFSRYIETKDLGRQEQETILEIIRKNVSFYNNKNLEDKYRDIMLFKIIENNLTDEDTIKMYEESCAQVDEVSKKTRKCVML